MKNFSLKFIDIMIGIVLGLGFQWWPILEHPWQYIAFIFVYLDIVDYWIDYSLSLKKFPPKKEVDVFLDLSIMFSLFLYIYTTTTSITYFLIAFILFKTLDYFWLLSSRHQYNPTGTDKLFVNTWMNFNLVEVVLTILLLGLTYLLSITPLLIMIAFITYRVIIRIVASFKYKKVHFV